MDADQTMAQSHRRVTGQSRRRSDWRRLVIALTICITGFTAQANEPTLAEVNQLLATGRIGQAAESLRAMDDAIKEGRASGQTDLTFPLAITARAFERANNLQDASEFYQRSVAAAVRESAKDLPPEKLYAVRLAAASTLARNGNQEAALDSLQPLLQSSAKLSEPRKKIALQICLHLGSQWLSANKPVLAERAYDLAAEHGNHDHRATAMLGAGWAAAMQPSKPEAAAKKLAEFIEAFPGHADAPRAASLQVTCLRQAGSISQANQLIDDLLDRWPESSAASEAISQYTADGPLSPAVQSWILERVAGGQSQSFSPALTAIGLLAAAHTGDEEAWSTLGQRLAATDSSGQPTSDLLQQLSTQKLNAYAQRLATQLMAPTAGTDAHAASREAACRWAGRQQLWSMLALASETSEPESDEPTRTIAIERLFAESLVQSGRADDSRKWWDHLVDNRKVSDFPTLLRCAEAATAAADVQQASQRIDAARAASDDNPARVVLVDLLSADLAIRQLRFDQARALLEKVVQSSQSVPVLRGRAQWMIGETFFLQQKFTEAIEAYRRVEGIDPDGRWVVVALVQAGKSFEQLGRTREAAVCYSSLVSRFGDSQYAAIARRRLAALAPSSSSPESNSRSQTIRR